jgi:hypothetical protein
VHYATGEPLLQFSTKNSISSVPQPKALVLNYQTATGTIQQIKIELNQK